MDRDERIMLSEVRCVRGAQPSPSRPPRRRFTGVTLSVRPVSCPRAQRCAHQAWTRQVLQVQLRLLQGLRALRGRMSRGKAKRPLVECVNAVEQARGALGIFRIYYPCGTADRRTVPCDFCFQFSRSVLYLLLVPQKAASAAGSEAG